MQLCTGANPDHPGAAYGYPGYGGWIGGQADYVMVPYADFNLLRLPPGAETTRRMRDLALLTDILPTGYHAAVSAGVGPGSSVYIAGAGPVGLACAASCRLLGASAVLVGDLVADRLAWVPRVGAIPVDIGSTDGPRDAVAAATGSPEVDAAVDSVGYESHGAGSERGRQIPRVALSQVIDVVRPEGRVGVPGYYIERDPGASDEWAARGRVLFDIGQAWAKSLTICMGGVPAMRYNALLLSAIMADRISIADAVNVAVVPLR